jgi:hypothetical protein
MVFVYAFSDGSEIIMQKSILTLGVIISTFVCIGLGFAQTDANLAVNNPDRQAWDLFLANNTDAATSGNNDALFETWANDGDTFRPKPMWPTTPSPPSTKAPRVLSSIMQHTHEGFQLGVHSPVGVPSGGGVPSPTGIPSVGVPSPPGVPFVGVSSPGENLIGEETRRNRTDFDFIVSNNLFKVSGLKAAYAAEKPITFPVDSVEVKANWVAVDRLREFNGFTGTPAEAARIYHVNTAGGKTYALVSFHIISKLVPNWTWATWEHKDNPGRCDIIGCRDTFGAQNTWIASLSPTESTTTSEKGLHYSDCTKSPALLALFAKTHIDPAFVNYCLKGTQTDFTDTSGLATRLGNSVIEAGFVNQSSCMSCHGRASFDSSGHPTSFAGSDILSPNLPIGDDNNTGATPIGPINPLWYWWNPKEPPSWPAFSDQTITLTRIALPADFVWSIPFCAIDDTAHPPQTRSRCYKR